MMPGGGHVSDEILSVLVLNRLWEEYNQRNEIFM